MKRRKICFFTGTRAEYGLLKPLIDQFKKERSVELQLIITGMHLSPEFGLTHKEIDLKSFSVVERVEILLSSDTSVGVCKAIGLGVISFGETLSRLKPDLIIGLGDRFELFALACAALVQNIPVAHIHGGELTAGAYDDAFRHSITKMSHIHFASTEAYRKRIIQLGENPKRVFNVGAIGIDNIRKIKLLSIKKLEESISFKLDKPYFVVTFHPATLENNSSEHQMKELLFTLNKFQDYKIIFTKANADNEGRIINKLIDDYIKANSRRAASFESLGQLRYLSALKYSSMMIGNSSSGIIEMPYFGIPTVNIGSRQKGRILSDSVIQCDPGRASIFKAIEKGLNPEFIRSIKPDKNFYGNGNAARKIFSIIKDIDFSSLINKEFYDLQDLT